MSVSFIVLVDRRWPLLARRASAVRIVDVTGSRLLEVERRFHSDGVARRRAVGRGSRTRIDFDPVRTPVIGGHHLRIRRRSTGSFLDDHGDGRVIDVRLAGMAYLRVLWAV